MSELVAAANARLGQTLRGKYTLDALLGVGGMAAVYRGIHRNGHRVAVKILHTPIAASEDVRSRFLREGYVANKVDHPGAVRVTDDDTAEDGAVFLVMELLDGETLESISEHAGISPRDVAALAYDLLDVLAAAHEKGIVHRDIKPENIFLTRDGVLKVLDFGIARLVDNFTTATATSTGRMVGTPAFMAPEQALGLTRDIDARTDLWSVGATMFTLVSGKLVHDAETVEAMVVYAGSRKARSVTTVAPIPESLAAVIDRALSFERADRFASARAMQSALARAYEVAFGEPLAKSGRLVSLSRLEQPRDVDVLAATMASGGLPAKTTAGLSTDGVIPRSRHPAWLLAPLVALGTGAALWAALASRHDQPKVDAVSPTLSIASIATASSSAIETPPAPASTTIVSAVPVLPVAPARSTKSAPPVVSVAPSTPPPKPNCDPPFTIDASGHRIPKQGCY